jgi:hypothetical protein
MPRSQSAPCAVARTEALAATARPGRGCRRLQTRRHRPFGDRRSACTRSGHRLSAQRGQRLAVAELEGHGPPASWAATEHARRHATRRCAPADAPAASRSFADAPEQVEFPARLGRRAATSGTGWPTGSAYRRRSSPRLRALVRIELGLRPAAPAATGRPATEACAMRSAACATLLLWRCAALDRKRVRGPGRRTGTTSVPAGPHRRHAAAAPARRPGPGSRTWPVPRGRATQVDCARAVGRPQDPVASPGARDPGDPGRHHPRYRCTGTGSRPGVDPRALLALAPRGGGYQIEAAKNPPTGAGRTDRRRSISSIVAMFTPLPRS